MKIAMDRKVSKRVVKRIRYRDRDEKYNEYTKNVINASDKLKNSSCETIEIISNDGVGLVGHWYPCENAKRIIIAMHGWRSSWSRDFGMLADFFRSNQCSVLYAEQRGQNNSGGDYMVLLQTVDLRLHMLFGSM